MSNWTPSIVPRDDDQNVYLVLDDLGRYGRAWREADPETTDMETVITDLLDGQYSNPVRVIGFNIGVGISIALLKQYRCPNRSFQINAAADTAITPTFGVRFSRISDGARRPDGDQHGLLDIRLGQQRHLLRRLRP